MRPAPPAIRPLQPLVRLRLRLTAWYVATFCVILALLGGGLFVAIRRQLSRQLDQSLRGAAQELARAARIREMEAASAHGTVVDAVDELHIPDRRLWLLDTAGRPVKPAAAPAWLAPVARGATAAGLLAAQHREPGGRTLRLYAQRVTMAHGPPLVAIAAADDVELEDRYAALIAAFGAAAAFALLLGAGGGWLLVRKSTAPVERTVEQMRRFMADAAHELRTPLTVLRTRAEVTLQQPRGTASYEQALRGIEAEARRLGGIVDDLLMLARADAGERPLARERLFLDDVALDAADAARAVAQARGVRLTIDEFEEAPVLGDAALLRQLVMILLDNAVKFTAPGGEVRVAVSAADGHATLTVRDTGIGIARDQLPHVFERFYRGDPARARGDGAGLGLSIARWIADEHGASIALESETGRGTLAAVELPSAPSASAAAPDPATTSPTDAPPARV